jgi:hypothetical protein
MPVALYWLIGSYLVLSVVNSLPIDDNAVSFSPFLICFCFTITPMTQDTKMNQTIQWK